MQNTRTPEREDRIRQVLSQRQQDLTIVMDNIWDPYNVSAILRNCDAFGILRVYLYYANEQWPNLDNKSPGSANKWVECLFHTDPEKLICELRGQGLQLLRTGFSSKSRPPWKYDLVQPTAIILGNEHRGVSQELCVLIPDEILIPMQGMIQSFNVSVAAGLILYEAAGQRRVKGLAKNALLTFGELERKVVEWLGR